jgi:serine/threonine-protein kinase PknK
LNDFGGLQLSTADVQALATSTDGWAAGLQLATLSLRSGADAHHLVTEMSGANEMIGDFLAESVLDSLDQDLAQFLLASSITERICGGLASALGQTTRGQAMLEEVERRGLFLQRVDGDPEWFRYHQMFAEFLRRRLERDYPDHVAQLHATAATWYAEHNYLSEAVDHALASNDPALAIDLVERDETRLLEQSKMTTWLGIIDKLPSQLVASRPRLQLTLGWAHILLQHTAAANAALNRFEVAVRGADLSEAARADMCAEANVVRAVAESFGDRIENIDRLVAEAMSRPDTLHPRAAGVAGNSSAFAAIYRFDFDAAYRLHDWAEPYNEMMGPFAGVYAGCYNGIAARYHLEIARAETSFRKAFEIGCGVGPHSHAARIAGALLGQLLYEKGDLAEAMRLLDESYELGSEGGGVDYLAARYVIGARLRAILGDRDSAVERLSAGMTVAGQLDLPRLASSVNNERVRLGLELAPAIAHRLRAARLIPVDGTARVTAELDEDSAIRLLCLSESDEDGQQACRRAGELLAGIDSRRRPFAALSARLLLAEVLTRTGSPDAPAVSSDVAAQCEAVGLHRLPVDAGISR